MSSFVPRELPAVFIIEPEPYLAIDWPSVAARVISDRDRALPRLRELSPIGS